MKCVYYKAGGNVYDLYSEEPSSDPVQGSN
jgi:hypothetical protein